MRLGGECNQITDSVVARTGGELGMKGEPAQRRDASSAAPPDRQLSVVDIATSGKEFRARNAIHDVNDTPLAVKPFPVFPFIPVASTIIHVQHTECPTAARTV